ncbi:GNAT family N-acetyltransferase [Patescibacteria group bacterium]|nr:GNAT family N-acetyltransferase [Patescibacteria group bacterium]
MARIILTGDKIRLRPLSKKDIPLTIKRNLDPKVLKWTAGSVSLDARIKRAASKKMEYFVKRRPKNDKIFIIEAKNGGRWEPIGNCGLSNINKWNHRAVFSICIDPDYWQRGYGTEATKLLLAYAFEKMHLHRIESHVREYNTPSIVFHRKFRFIEESRQKEAIFQNGRFWDRIIFRLLESEWENLDRQ